MQLRLSSDKSRRYRGWGESNRRVVVFTEWQPGPLDRYTIPHTTPGTVEVISRGFFLHHREHLHACERRLAATLVVERADPHQRVCLHDRQRAVPERSMHRFARQPGALVDCAKGQTQRRRDAPNSSNTSPTRGCRVHRAPEKNRMFAPRTPRTTTGLLSWIVRPRGGQPFTSIASTPIRAVLPEVLFQLALQRQACVP